MFELFLWLTNDDFFYFIKYHKFSEFSTTTSSSPSISESPDTSVIWGQWNWPLVVATIWWWGWKAAPLQQSWCRGNFTLESVSSLKSQRCKTPLVSPLIISLSSGLVSNWMRWFVSTYLWKRTAVTERFRRSHLSRQWFFRAPIKTKLESAPNLRSVMPPVCPWKQDRDSEGVRSSNSTTLRFQEPATTRFPRSAMVDIGHLVCTVL